MLKSIFAHCWNISVIIIKNILTPSPITILSYFSGYIFTSFRHHPHHPLTSRNLSWKICPYSLSFPVPSISFFSTAKPAPAPRPGNNLKDPAQWGYFLWTFYFIFYEFILFPASWFFVAAHGGYSSFGAGGFHWRRLLLLQSVGLSVQTSVAVAHGLTVHAQWLRHISLVARGISETRNGGWVPLHRQADAQPLEHQASPRRVSVTHCNLRDFILGALNPHHLFALLCSLHT